MNKEERYEQYERYKALREQGKTYQEIADIVGRTRSGVKHYCEKHGLAYSKEEYSLSRVRNSTRYDEEGWTQKVKARYGESFEVVSVGDTNDRCERPLIIRCKICGTEKSISSITLRVNGTSGCMVCQSKARLADKQIKEERERVKKENLKIKRRLKTRQVGFKFCECGAILAYRDKLCDECKVKHKKEQAKRQSYESCKEIWYKAERKRKARLKGVKSDKDATLKALYEKYNGICYLCGEVCDWNDGRWERGVFRVGGRYPSREHVIALKNGGDDTWSNLKLAHLACNSKKGAKTVEKSPPS